LRYRPVCGQSELFGLKWGDIDLVQGAMNVTRSIVYGVVGPCKTESSQKARARSIRLLADCFIRTGENNVPTPSQTIGFFCQQAPPRAEAILGTGDPAQISSTGLRKRLGIRKLHRLAHVFVTMPSSELCRVELVLAHFGPF